ncbi:beta-1,6-N-acetylglucosaminyltransferase [Aeromonas caviae]|uniref:beta-1,6-N-acetylglucosaminyltransferase n=1 Tax=Aeromonas caviae TaxID=648 RepID=UPI001CD388B8|nr:beta-1,6-N-acetylglucosaminyltransferase [Aeromonas caviae]UBS66986.1 beta-1,6-N-acetylglucosaminyltransferase [Aeromonas caviae]
MHAFLIQAHKDTIQFRRLLILLNSHGRTYIHIDKKFESVYQSLNTWKDQCVLENVVFIEKRVSVMWGHYSQVVATINLLEHALKDDNSAFTLLSGECLPIKNVSDFISFVSSSNKSYLAHSIQPKMRTRVSKIHFFVDNKHFPKSLLLRKGSSVFGSVLSVCGFRNSYFDNVDIYKGSPWFTLKRDVVHWLVYNCNVKELIEKFKYSVCVDEVFFHTIIGNSEWLRFCVNDNLFHIEWNGAKNPSYLKLDSAFTDGKFWGRKFSLTDTELDLFFKNFD